MYYKHSFIYFIHSNLMYICRYWDKLSPHILHDAILLLPIKPKYIKKEIPSPDNLLYQHNLYENRAFIDFLKSKVAQKMVIFMRTDNDDEDTECGSPIYTNISNKLSELNHNKLNLSKKYWYKNREVLKEIQQVNCKYSCIKTIISDSNKDIHVISC